MSDQCPHCQGELKDHVPRSRINEKNETIKKLEADLASAGPKVAAFDQTKAELETTKAELESLRTTSTRSLAAARSGFTNEEAMPFLELAYKQAQAGKADGEEQSFQDWIAAADGAREHPATKGFWVANIGPTDTTAAPGSTVTGGPPKAGPPAATTGDGGTEGGDGGKKPEPRQPGGKIDAGAKPAGSSKMASPEQWRAYFNSDEYTSLPPDKQREQLDAYKAEVAATRGNAAI